MIITRTPFRVSFFGGGTDYRAWYLDNGGAVLATTIDKYCYISCRYLPPFFDVRYRTVYSEIELTKRVEDIHHPSVRACLQHLDFGGEGTEIVHNSDLPARTGIGSSSSFTVGLLHALSGLKGRMPSKRQLAEMAIDIEQNVLAENVGSQDQVSAAFGGFNLITFDRRGFELRPVTMRQGRLRELEQSLLLIYTGVARNASEIAKHQIENIGKRHGELREMRAMVDHAVEILMTDCDLREFGRLLHESWMLKARLSDRIATDVVNDIYAKARAHGAVGGKLLGAGGGGFILLYVDRDRVAELTVALDGFLQVPFRFEHRGTQVIYFQQSPS